MGDGDDLKTLGWRMSKIEELIDQRAKDNLMFRALWASLLVSNGITILVATGVIHR